MTAPLARCREATQTVDEVAALRAENLRLTALLNTPETRDFAEGVIREAAHQRERWGEGHDTDKEPEEWFWLVGYGCGQGVGGAARWERRAPVAPPHHGVRDHGQLASAARGARWN